MVSQDELRNRIVRCAEDCEGALRSADAVARHGTVRERLRGIAFHEQSAHLFSDCAFTWASMIEVAA